MNHSIATCVGILLMVTGSAASPAVSPVLLPAGQAAPTVIPMDAAAATNPEVDALIRHYRSTADRYVFLAGGASRMSEARRGPLTRLLEDSLPRIAKGGRLVVGDGGTETGIMQAAGNARRTSQGAFQLLGIAPAPEIAPGAGQRVDPNHSAVIAVENRPWLEAQRARGWQRDWGHFGSETESMYRVFGRLAEGRPSVAIVANGGGITLDEVRQNVAQGRSMILLEGSGRVTDALAQEVLGRRVPIPDDPAARAEFDRLVTQVRAANLPPERFSVVPVDAGSRALSIHVERILRAQQTPGARLASVVRANLSAGSLLWRRAAGPLGVVALAGGLLLGGLAAPSLMSWWRGRDVPPTPEPRPEGAVTLLRESSAR